MSFTPSIASDRSKYGIRIDRQAYPVGVAGVRLSLTEIARKIREGGRTPSMRQFAEMVVRQKMAPSAHTGNTAAASILLEYVVENVRYRSDPAYTEWTQSAPVTLCVNGAPMCIPVGDCDDLVVALGSLLMSYGIQVRIVKQTFGATDQEHVLVEFQDESGSWIAADPTPRGPSLSIGQKAVASHEDYIDPLDPSAIGMVAGTPEAEFIGVGRAPERTRIVNLVDGHYEEFAHGKLWRLVGDTWIEKEAPSPRTGFGNLPRMRIIGAITADSYTQAKTDLANQVSMVVAAGDTYMNATPPEYAEAISAYQAAGNAGATSVGPSIDTVGSPVTPKLTQEAWNLNTSLAALAPAGATIDTARNAQSLAKRIEALYTEAISTASGPLPKGGLLNTGVSPWVFIVGGGAAGGLLFVALRGTHSKRRSRRR